LINRSGIVHVAGTERDIGEIGMIHRVRHTLGFQTYGAMLVLRNAFLKGMVIYVDHVGCVNLHTRQIGVNAEFSFGLGIG